MKEFLQHKMYTEIPITRQMGLKIVSAGDKEILISAPLEPNINHNATVFGGTIASALLLSGWALTESRLKKWGISAHVVVMKTEIEYLLPVEGEFTAGCFLEDERVWQEFQYKLLRKGKARIRLEGAVRVDGEVAARFTGQYVALMETAPS